MTPSTFELGLTRLWYLVGDWQGTGSGEDFGVQALARFEWTLNDHFIAGFIELRDAGSDQVLSTEHVYLYYNREENGVAGLFFAQDGLVERAVGPIDTVGHFVMLSTRLDCVPMGFPRSQLRRSFQLLDPNEWQYSIEMDAGHGLCPYATVHMQRKLPVPE
ncbi:MAG: FABP family protein [Thermoflexales bacterium]|nr:FABP family protein [Thermoflexales bacterium]